MSGPWGTHRAQSLVGRGSDPPGIQEGRSWDTFVHWDQALYLACTTQLAGSSAWTCLDRSWEEEGVLEACTAFLLVRTGVEQGILQGHATGGIAWAHRTWAEEHKWGASDSLTRRSPSGTSLDPQGMEAEDTCLDTGC